MFLFYSYCHHILVKSESCVQYSVTPLTPVFQIQKLFQSSLFLTLLQHLSFQKGVLPHLFNTFGFCLLLDDSFSHLYHLQFAFSSYMLELPKGIFSSSYHCPDFLPTLITLSSLLNIPQEVRLGTVLLLSHCAFYCPFLKEYHLILISTYFSDLRPLETFLMCYRASYDTFTIASVLKLLYIWHWFSESECQASSHTVTSKLVRNANYEVPKNIS